jgi:hypothetical protein
MSQTSELILPDQTEFLQYKATTVKNYDRVYIFVLHTRHSNCIRLRNVISCYIIYILSHSAVFLALIS